MDIKKLDLSRPLGNGVVTLDFMAVNVDISIGKPVYPKVSDFQTLMAAQEAPGVFYTQEQHFVFDRADIDEAIIAEIVKIPKLDRQPATLADVMKLASGMALDPKILRDKTEEDHTLKNLLNEKLPAEITWQSDYMSMENLPAFVTTKVPFHKTRELIFETFGRMVAASTDRFIDHIRITHRSVYTLH